MRPYLRGVVLVLASAGLFGPIANAGKLEKPKIDIQPPPPGRFVRDLAGLVGDKDEAEIQKTCAALLKDRATPIIVVTIESMAKHGGKGLTIEMFAKGLFDQWSVGEAATNKGILLLVAKDDRRARIELGAGWSRTKDAECQRIMDEAIIPRFKKDEFSAGITAGVQRLAKMARE